MRTETTTARLAPATLAIGLGCLLLAACCLAVRPAAAEGPEAPWWPIQVKSYYGTYDPTGKKPGQASPSLKRPKLEEWIPPRPADERYVIGVSIPHLKDPYWLSVNYGLVAEAERLGVGLHLLEAGGYESLWTQVLQVRKLAASGVDGIIIAAISYSGADGIIREIEDRGIHVVGMINDVSAPAVSAKALVSFQEMGYYAGEFVAEDAEKAGLGAVRVLLFPGPRNSSWGPETLDGFMEAMEYFPGKVEIADVAWGDTGADVQRGLVLDSLKRHGPVDYIVGNGVAADVASDLLAREWPDARTRVVATYLIPPLYDKILSRRVAAAPSDLNVFQGRMAVDMMVRILTGEKPGADFPFRSGPFIPMVTSDNIANYPFEALFGPRGFSPVFTVQPRE